MKKKLRILGYIILVLFLFFYFSFTNIQVNHRLKEIRKTNLEIKEEVIELKKILEDCQDNFN